MDYKFFKFKKEVIYLDSQDPCSRILEISGYNSIGDLGWRSRVNSSTSLEACCDDSGVKRVKGVEGDVYLGHMGHPPGYKPKLTFKNWIDRLHEAGHVAKPDFKRRNGESEMPPNSHYLCETIKDGWGSDRPIILNADVRLGPNSERSPFAPIDSYFFADFIAENQRTNPYVIASLGWITSINGHQRAYDPHVIESMLKTVDPVKGHITFPFDARLVPGSMYGIKMICDSNLRFSVTVYAHDGINPELVKWLLENMDPNRTFFDLPLSK